VTTESRLRRKKKRRVLGIVFQFLFFVLFWYGVSFFVLENRPLRLLVAITLAALVTIGIAGDKTTGKIVPGRRIRCPRCNTNGIVIRRTGERATCKRCKRESSWAELVVDQRNSSTDGA